MKWYLRFALVIAPYILLVYFLGKLWQAASLWVR